MMLHQDFFFYGLKRYEKITHIIQLELCQHEEHSDWGLFLWNSDADKYIRNLKEVSAEGPL